MKREIDWLAVDMVVGGARMKLTADEKRMVIRRLADRLLNNDEYKHDYWSPATITKITAGKLAERMFLTERSVQRIKDDLRPAQKQVCPVCREPMWVYDDGTVEAHPDRLADDCEMTGRQLPQPLRGLAALRPDLYPWLEVVS